MSRHLGATMVLGKRRRTKRAHVDGQLIARCSYSATYGHHQLTEVCFPATFDEHHDHVYFSSPEFVAVGDDYHAALGGIRVPQSLVEEVGRNGWNPLERAHPYTGALFFDWFEFLPNDANCPKRTWDGETWSI
ncbi:MAG: hypothetical protein ING75_16190 [Rhodocyclaceae bacterium]|nr:hypothetical protein [Rhodocyclaceae bacterium]